MSKVALGFVVLIPTFPVWEKAIADSNKPADKIIFFHLNYFFIIIYLVHTN